MPIAHSAALQTLLEGQFYGIHPRVRVQRATEVGWNDGWVDLTSRLVQGTISATMDDNSRAFSLSFDAGHASPATSLQPLMTGSSLNDPTPLLWGGNHVEIAVALTPLGATPAPEDYMVLEVGRIDTPDGASTPGVVTVTGRDIGSAKLLQARVRHPDEAHVYEGLVGPVVNQIVSDWVGPGIWGPWSLGLGPLFPSGTPQDSTGADWVLNPYAPSPATAVLEAIRAIALQIGWDFRHFPRYFSDGRDLSDAVYAFAFYDPDRERTTPDDVIPPSQYTRVVELKVPTADVRNWIVGRAGKTSDRIIKEAEDTASQAQYGVEWMEIGESMMSNIDTEAEVQRMVDYALADQKDPYASHAVETLLRPFVELNDLVTHPANAVHYDTALTGAVVSYTHTFTKGGGRTTLYTRGKPIAAYRRWRQGYQPPVLVSLLDPPPGPNAREGTLWCKVADLSFPP